MAIVEIAVGKSKYKIECDSKEKEKLLSLASILNERVNHISSVIRNADEKTILVITSLMIMAESEQNQETQITETKETPTAEAESDSSLINLKEITKQIENLINKVKNY
ncbi:MAG: cell division protein ZapA [Pelagibacterales bacterium]|nr:cell division protein ZapA [Pelagibacterales bacterium]